MPGVFSVRLTQQIEGFGSKFLRFHKKFDVSDEVHG
jgi:hypothetical protein